MATLKVKIGRFFRKGYLIYRLLAVLECFSFNLFRFCSRVPGFPGYRSQWSDHSFAATSP